MTIPSKLNLSDKTKAAMLTAPENRVRAKMLDAIETQIAAAEADAAGEPYTKLTSRYTTNEETSEADHPKSVRVPDANAGHRPEQTITPAAVCRRSTLCERQAKALTKP